MNIVILAGGTGSIALQQGLFTLLGGLDGVDTKVIVNAYDNGLSTGMVRKVCGGKILGPSDVRKNQTTRLKLENPSSPLNNFLDIRFTIESDKAEEFCLDKIGELSSLPWPHLELLREAVEEFFSTPAASKIDYTDFSLANIIYAGFAKANKNSLRTAATIMSSIMGIADNVLLNDDTSLFLGAITKSGKVISDEGDIVSWGNKEDPFCDVFFTDADGYRDSPVLCQESIDALVAADLIILSSGTQWSSLIPTYASTGFSDVLSKCSAKVLMVMNRQPDKDSPGQTASDIIRTIVPKYFPKNLLHVILDTSGSEQMNTLDSSATALVASANTFDLRGADSPTKHNSSGLARAIATTYFKDYLYSAHYMFDYDDTLVGRGNTLPKSSKTNRELLAALNVKTNVSVCTGNSIKAISLDNSKYLYDMLNMERRSKPITVFADGGVNKYTFEIDSEEDADERQVTKFVECIAPQAILRAPHDAKSIVNTLKENGVFHGSIENRGDVQVCIKPVHEEYRTLIINLLGILFKDSDLVIHPAGRSTIEIHDRDLSKVHAVQYILDSGAAQITYVGDELTYGNDSPVAKMNHPKVRCLSIKDAAETAFFLITLRNTLIGT